jgi:hypothetical protein
MGTTAESFVEQDVELSKEAILTMKAVAIRTGQKRQHGPAKFHDIAAVECDKCDAEYVIRHNRVLKGSPIIAEAQAAELKTILIEDHDPKGRREHPDLVEF